MGVKPDGLVEILYSPVVLTYISVGSTTGSEGFRQIRVELDRLIVVPNGSIVLVLGSIGEAPIEKSNGVSGVDPD
jgi:hypothetical protein